MTEISPLPVGETPGDDILTGAAEIGAFLGKTTRQVQHLIDTKSIPAFKLGGRWHLRKSTARALIARLEASAMEAA